MARTEGLEPPLFGFVDRRVHPVTPRSHQAESSGLEPQLFIHLFSKQRRSPDRVTLHHLVNQAINQSIKHQSNDQSNGLVGRAGVAPATY